jgi:hypothetical protein
MERQKNPPFGHGPDQTSEDHELVDRKMNAQMDYRHNLKMADGHQKRYKSVAAR